MIRPALARIFDRVQMLKYALDEEVSSPYELYFRLSAPVRREVETSVAQARREALKREAAGVKPRSSTGTESGIMPGTDLRTAVAQAMKEAESETGLSFKNLFGRKVRTEG